MCLYPRLIKNKKFTANKKNGGVVPPVNDERTLYVPVGCGKCIECMKKKAREWQIRLSEEIRTAENAKFITLTFKEEALVHLMYEAEIYIEGLPSKKAKNKIEENEVARIATRRFLERWRSKYGKSVKHWFVTELGHTGTERIHMHGIIWTDKTKEEIEERWGYGMIWIGEYVNEKTINYIVKYIHKIDEDHKGYQPKVLTSAGIGRNYINRYDAHNNKYNSKGETNEAYKFRNGLKSALPIYYRNKIYSEEEREKLWIEKLDKEERWINGEKVSTENGYKEYLDLLEYHRKINKKLGYGNDDKDWDIDTYKEQRKKLKELKKVAQEKNNTDI